MGGPTWRKVKNPAALGGDARPSGTRAGKWPRVSAIFGTTMGNIFDSLNLTCRTGRLWATSISMRQHRRCENKRQKQAERVRKPMRETLTPERAGGHRNCSVSPSYDTNTAVVNGRLYYVAPEGSSDAKAQSQSRSGVRGCGIVVVATEWNVCSKRRTCTRSIDVECRNEPRNYSWRRGNLGRKPRDVLRV